MTPLRFILVLLCGVVSLLLSILFICFICLLRFPTIPTPRRSREYVAVRFTSRHVGKTFCYTVLENFNLDLNDILGM